MKNIQLGKFNWGTSFLFSYNRVKVKKLYVQGTTTALNALLYTPFNEGYDLNRLFGYKWAGLDPQTGDPRGYAGGKVVTLSADNITGMNAVTSSPISDLHFFGSSVPVCYGSLRNTLGYGPATLSVSLLYKLGYYARRPDADLVNYGYLFGYNGGSNTPQGAEYARRWQKPGDELTTNVPSQVYRPGFDPRFDFYKYSEINIYKADHVRLQEVNLSYNFKKGIASIKNLSLFANVTDLGIIWRANKLGLDPDINDYPQPRTYSIGLSANL